MLRVPIDDGSQEVQTCHAVMPAFGDNPNVMCYLNDIYVYLKGRDTDAVPRGRPPKKEAKSDVIREDEEACLG